jgi:CHAT domain-containing protein/tetratricopeptide (TPR) repeat protein
MSARRNREPDRINGATPVSGLRELAERALAARQGDPREAIALGQRVLTGAGRLAYPMERSIAERAIGLAHKELNDLDAAQRHLRRAVAAGRRGDCPRTTALAQMSLGYVLAAAGRTTAARTAVTAALSELTGPDAAQALMQRGVVHYFRGRYVEAADDYGAAIAVAVREGEALIEARARNNRAILPVGNPDAADDLDRAAAIFRGLGLELAAADARWNAGHLAAQRGDVARALDVFAEVDREYRRLAVPRPALILDRFELFASVPLVEEATGAAATAMHELHRRGLASDLAEAMLAGARAALLGGDAQTAARLAAQARTRLRRQGRPMWSAFARHVELRAHYRRGTRTVALSAAMARNADLLDAGGWSGPALTGRVEAARVAIEVGRPQRARDLLIRVARHRRGGTAGQRAQGWYGQALLHRLDGDDRAAATALRRGMSVLDDHRVSLGATELRANSGAHGADLAGLGLALAIDSRRPGAVLAWAERWRSSTLRMTPVLPHRDPALAAALTQLRTVTRQAEDALLSGVRAAVPLRRQAALEARVRDLARRAAGPPEGAVGAVPGVRLLAASLGTSALVELITQEERLLAVVVRDGRATLHELGALPAVLRQVRRVRFELRRLVTIGSSTGAPAGLAHAAEQLDRLLFDPVRRRIDDRPLVIVPGGALHAVPWAALPTAAGRPVTVAPSAAAWCAAAGRPEPIGPPVLVAGPRLPEAIGEIDALARVWGDAVVHTGGAATVGAVTASFGGARLVHIAAHGAFRADNPLFSALELADGPLTAYELERLPAAPGCLIASACDSGLSDVRPGDELMGFAAVLFGQGVRTLIASLLPVPSAGTVTLMVHLHQRLRNGVPPARALHEAQVSLRAGGDPADLATAAAFACFGAG